MPESALIRFYRGSGTDQSGRRLDEILAWDDAALERVHDYIQWVFPNAEPSRANPFAPLLSAADCDDFRTEPALRATLRRALDRMLAFYGLERHGAEGAVEIRPSAGWGRRSPNWLNPSNHNHLRLTRIMKCLTALGLDDDARALQRTLVDLAERSAPRLVTRATVRYWKSALD